MEELKHLNKIVGDYKREVKSLKKSLKKANQRIEDLELYEWQNHSEIPHDDFRENLPVPRIEMIITPNEDLSEVVWIMGLVIEHIPTEPNYLFIPLGSTTGRGDYSQSIKRLPTPFRDGVHMKDNVNNLQIPGFVTCPRFETHRQTWELYNEGFPHKEKEITQHTD